MKIYIRKMFKNSIKRWKNGIMIEENSKKKERFQTKRDKERKNEIGG